MSVVPNLLLTETGGAHAISSKGLTQQPPAPPLSRVPGEACSVFSAGASMQQLGRNRASHRYHPSAKVQDPIYTKTSMSRTMRCTKHRYVCAQGEQARVLCRSGKMRYQVPVILIFSHEIFPQEISCFALPVLAIKISK